ncbi:hypothetical protein Emin_0249 [Elusimicrobium minutum Pei191]|uniref:ECF transporter S component n=1 Tax=Elusimicrobium minutum (strain Pei191) TaxID=445932 RepID=B2KB52_ELUMP|nr:ECF transporter S component [Elusimicrobium minutum]ACC97811.1 hypothetical protein Emin_0249 [Elusimicrobium minutum Pei191]
MQNILALRTKTNVLDYKTKKAIILQVLLLASALVLPAVCHHLNLQTKVFLPMHWPVLLAGLVYGWRSGLTLGISAPLASFALSGMPPAHILPIMTLELAVYGFAAGAFRQQLKLNFIFSLLGAMILGKAVYILTAYTLAGSASFAFIQTSLPGIILQAVLLPLIALIWTKNK